MKKIPLNFVCLKYFCDAVKHGSISASAKLNSVSQSAVSQAIAKLEEGIGEKLISHQQNRFKITEQGQKLFEGSKSIFHAVRLVEESFSKEGASTLEFGCSHSFALALLPIHIKEARRCFPSLQLNFRLGHTDAIKDWVRKGIIDFGIVLDNDDLSSFDCEEIYQGKYCLYVAKKCKDPGQMSFLLSEERLETTLLKKKYMKKMGRQLPILMEISSWEVIASLAEEGVGVGFFPDYIARNRHKELKLLDFKMDPIPYKIYAIFPKNSHKSASAEKFLSLLKSR